MRTSVVLALLATGLIAAGEPLPPPGPPPLVLPPPYVRVNRYEVWQNYGVDHRGFFRPRVVYTPDGAFYYSNGEPYPYLSTQPLYFMPHARD